MPKRPRQDGKAPPPSSTTTVSYAGWQCYAMLWALSPKLRIRIPDIILFSLENGTPTQWLFTSRKGEVSKKKKESLSLTLMYHRLTTFATQEASYCAVLYLETGERVYVNKQQLRFILPSTTTKSNVVGKWRDEKIHVIRAYIPPKGGHGSGFRNSFKMRGTEERPMTSTQKLLALSQHIAVGKKSSKQTQASKMTKFKACSSTRN